MNKTETTVKTEGKENQEKVVLLTSMKELEAEQGAPKKAKPSAKADAEPKVPKKVEPSAKTDAPKKAESPAKKEAKPKAPEKAESPAKQEAKPKVPEKEESPAKTSVKTDVKPKAPGPESPARAEAPAAPPKAEEPPAPVSSVTAPPAAVERPATSVLDSPLKMMKQEFDRRACVIRTEMANIQNSFVTIGFQLHWIKTNNMYKVLDYKTISEYAEKEYNIKRGTCANLINIIENFAERDEQGHVIESITECYRNFSSSQLLAMIGMPEEVQQQVTPDMSVRSILKLRKGEPETPPIDAPKAVITDIKEPEAPAPAPRTEAKTEAGPAPAAPKTAPTQATQPVNKGIWKTSLPERKPAVSATSYSSGYTPKAAEPPKTGKPETVEIAELGSYNDYESKQGKIAQMMKNVFSKNEPVKVKIVCVYKD